MIDKWRTCTHYGVSMNTFDLGRSGALELPDKDICAVEFRLQ